MGLIMTGGLFSSIIAYVYPINQATTTTSTGVPECFGGPPTIVGTDNDDVIEG